jgi:hypothetical protein
MQKHPERHNFSVGDIAVEPAPEPQPRTLARAMATEPTLPGAPLAEAKPEMDALEKKVERGIRVELGKAVLEDGQIVLPFELRSRDSRDQYQLRVTINTDESASKRFKVVVKGFKKE